MELVSKALLYIHLLGFAAVAGGLLTQLTLKKRQVTSLAVNGARVQFLTGILLWITAVEGDFTQSGLGLKFLGAAIILGLLEANRKKGLSQTIYYLLLAVLAAQVIVAVFFLEAAK